MRDYKYDTLKGILIFLVVFSHILITNDYVPKNEYYLIAKSIYLFHMPLFFIISGHFSKSVKKDKIIKYLVFFLFMNAAFSLYDYIKYGNLDIFEFKYSSWFILLLVIYRLIINNHKIANLILKKYSIFFIFTISIVSGLLFKNINLVRLFSFFYFFAFGYKNNFALKKGRSWILLCISIILLMIIISLNPPLEFLMISSYSDFFELFIRTIIFVADTMLFVGIIGIISNKKISLITSFGKNSIYIYIFHRIPTLIFCYMFYPHQYFLMISLIISIIVCLVINYLSKYLKSIMQVKKILPISFIIIIIPILFYNFRHEFSIKEQNIIDDTISIGFVGDLILLENQLKLSNNDFNYMFDNLNEYFNNTDYVFGVLEGPVDDDSELSYGNFDDNKELRLNYPTTFLKGIENSGIDFVTISNNHIFDRGLKAYYNTIKNLDNSNLDYIGTKNNYKIIDIEGIKVGVLAYTYGLNYLENDDYLEYINFIVEPYSKDFEKTKENVHNDFQKLKDSNVDLIIVMPHYGTQFSNKVDIYQEVWNRIFINEGANIILGDHSHAIEPIQYKNDAIIINSPGNYINSYVEYNGDISMYVKIYLDKNSHKIVASSITPIIASKDSLGRYYPVLLNYASKENQERVVNLFSEVIFKNKISEIKDTYYYLPNDSYKYDNKYKLELTDKDKESLVYRKINEHNKICFIGDSITEGTLNDYYPWYNPLMSYFDKEVVNISKGGYTSLDIINEFSKKIKNSNCDLSIINIGTNDIRYNSEDVNNYIKNINQIIKMIDGEVIVLAPWQTTKRDFRIDENDTSKRKLYNIYNEYLKKLSNIYYIDPNPYIKEAINYNGEESYLIDGIHPNNEIGIKLYSFAVLRGDVQKKAD